MLQKIKQILSSGRNDVAAKVREVVCGEEAERFLLEFGNERYLVAFVEYGHQFKSSVLYDFLRIAEKRLVLIYLTMGFELDNEAKQVVLGRDDEELFETLVNSGSWVPFPHGCCNTASAASHSRNHDDDEDELETVA